MTLRTQMKKQTSDALTSFLQKLLIAGSAWFLCFPLLVFLAGFLVHCPPPPRYGHLSSNGVGSPSLPLQAPNVAQGWGILIQMPTRRRLQTCQTNTRPRADLRHRVVAGGTLVTQAICLSLLSTQFLSQTSTYSRCAAFHRSLSGVGLGCAVL
jgi:hypothetical protein